LKVPPNLWNLFMHSFGILTVPRTAISLCYMYPY
jgi:hypothetical protein